MDAYSIIVTGASLAPSQMSGSVGSAIKSPGGTVAPAAWARAGAAAPARVPVVARPDAAAILRKDRRLVGAEPRM